MNIKNVILKTWQSALIEYMKPSYREVIWVQGAKCEEGKSWMQEYIEAKFGWEANDLINDLINELQRLY